MKTKVQKLVEEMGIIKTESEREMVEIKSIYDSEKIQWQTECDGLQSDLEIARIELASAREESKNLEKEIKVVEKNRNELETLLLAQIEDVTTRKDAEISEIKVEAEDVRSGLVKEIEELEKNLADSEKYSETLLQDLEKAKMELTNELIAFKEKTKKELDAIQQSLNERNMELLAKNEAIDALETERTSVRTLFRLQGSLVKKRIQKRLKRKKK